MMLIKTDQLFTPFFKPGTFWLEVQQGRVENIHTTPPPEGEQVLDLSGLIITPGWVEIQINGAFGFDFTDDPSVLWQVTEKLPQLGITTCLPTIITSPPETVQQTLVVWQAGPPQGYAGSFVPGLHLEGPYLNPAKNGAHRSLFIQPPPQETPDWSPQDGVRLVTLAPEQPGALKVISGLVESGVVVSAGHSLATYAQAKQAFQAGVRLGTHLFNAMRPLDHREPGLVGALLSTADVKTGIIVDGIHVAPMMVNLAWQLKGPHGIILVTDAMAALGQPSGEYQLGGSRVIVTEDDARLQDGTLAGSILTPLKALLNLIEFSGCSFEEALYAWTINPASALGLPDRGELKPGSAADLVVLNPDYSIRLVMVNGKIVFQND